MEDLAYIRSNRYIIYIGNNRILSMLVYKGYYPRNLNNNFIDFAHTPKVNNVLEQINTSKGK